MFPRIRARMPRRGARWALVPWMPDPAFLRSLLYEWASLLLVLPVLYSLFRAMSCGY
jgi:hypothetical protein